jgi:hypothetical protein
MSDEKPKTLLCVKAGDTVAVMTGLGKYAVLRQVVRVTPKYIILPNNYLYYRESGVPIGSAAGRLSVDPDDIAKGLEQELTRKKLHQASLDAEKAREAAYERHHDALNRVKNFIVAYEAMNQAGPVIYGLHLGTEHQASLTLADLKEIVGQGENTG